MSLIGQMAKALRTFTLGMGNMKRGPLVKCRERNFGSTSSSPSLVYDKSFCLFVEAADDGPNKRREWYMLHVSSDKDKCKEEEEKKGERVVRIKSPEHRGSYLAFHHDERHQGQQESTPLGLPLITKLEVDRQFFGDTFFVVGSIIYYFGWGCGFLEPSRKITYFDTSHPDGGWKRGPCIIGGRAQAAMVALQGKLYVFGGCRPYPDVWAAFLDTTLLDLEEKGKVAWSPLPDHSGPLGFVDLFAIPVDHGEFSGKILVGSRSTERICLYDVTHEVWKNLSVNIGYGLFSSNPIVVGTTIYWVDLFLKVLCAYSISQRTKFSMPLGDFKICKLLDHSYEEQRPMGLTLMHLAGDDFCMLWMCNDGLLHCTKFRVCTTLMDAYVLCCHSYSFDHRVFLLECVPVQPGILSSSDGDG